MICLLSGGEKQRTSLARALIMKPSIVLADEPTGNLDAENARIVMNQLSGVKKENRSIILVTHNQQLAQCGDASTIPKDSSHLRTTILLNGEGLYAGGPTCMVSEYTRRLLFGSTTQNVIEVMFDSITENNVEASPMLAIKIGGILDYTQSDLVSTRQFTKNDNIYETYFDLYIDDAYLHTVISPLLGHDIVLSDIVISANSSNIESIERELRGTFSQNHDVFINSQASQWRERMELYSAIKYLLFAVSIFLASICSLIIMNVVVFSIKERVSEIAIRMTLGSLPLQIRGQVSLEVSILAFIGCTIGVLLALVLCYSVYILAHEKINSFFRLNISSKTILSCYLMAFAIGLISSVLPANIANRIEVAISLRKDL